MDVGVVWGEGRAVLRVARRRRPATLKGVKEAMIVGISRIGKVRRY